MDLPILVWGFSGMEWNGGMDWSVGLVSPRLLPCCLACALTVIDCEPHACCYSKCTDFS